MAFEIELPRTLIEDVIEDVVPNVAGQTPVLINLDPESGEVEVPRATVISLEIATLDSVGEIDVTTVRIYVGGVLAFDGGVFAPEFGGPESTFFKPQSDVLRVVLDNTGLFPSEGEVVVRVLARALGDPSELDSSYSFFIEDTVGPRMLSAEAIGLRSVRVRFNEFIDSGARSGAAWRLDRLGDFVTPIVSAYVTGATYDGIDSSALILETDIPLTPGGNYRISGLTVADMHGNLIEPPYDVVDFLGWRPPRPDGRNFDLYKKLPDINRGEDVILDLKRFCGCLQEVTDLLLYDIDRFTDMLDPDVADEQSVDLMLSALGNPFDFDLTLTDKRRLVRVLVEIYKLKGTAPGIVNAVRFFLGIDVEVDVFNTSNGFILGESLLGAAGSTLHTGISRLLFSFDVVSPIVLTEAQRAQMVTIIQYMKSAPSHFVKLREPAPPPEVIDHASLGESMLGVNFFLHEGIYLSFTQSVAPAGVPTEEAFGAVDITSLAAPVLTAVNFDLADSAGDDTIIVTGTDLDAAIGATWGGTPCAIDANTPTSITLTLPAKAAGSHNIVVTTAGGASNGLAVEAWSPEDEADCAIFSEAPDYDGTTFTSRKGANWSGGIPPAASSGMPNFAGGGAGEFLTGPSADSILTGGAGSIFVVSYQDTALISGAALPVYDAGLISVNSTYLNVNYGDAAAWFGFASTALSASVFDGVDWNEIYIKASTGAYHAALVRYQNSGTFEMQVNGKKDDGTSGFESKSMGTYTPGSQPFRLGTGYNQFSMDGRIRAVAIFTTKVSDTVAAKLLKWARIRHGVA